MAETPTIPQARDTKLLRASASVAGFLMRNAATIGILSVGPVVLWVVLYMILMILALVFGEGVGGPVALPFGMLAIFFVSLFTSVIFLMPPVALAEAIARWRKWPTLLQWPIALGLVLIASMAIWLSGWEIRTIPSSMPQPIVQVRWQDPGAAYNVPIIAFCWMAGVSIYWWLSQGSLVLIEVVQALGVVAAMAHLGRSAVAKLKPLVVSARTHGVRWLHHLRDRPRNPVGPKSG